jgi:hypothetical protein
MELVSRASPVRAMLLVHVSSGTAYLLRRLPQTHSQLPALVLFELCMGPFEVATGEW